MSVYLTNPDSLPDSEFEPGVIHHLVVGNRGRMLDHRRTPVSVVDLNFEAGFVVLRIDDFEDAGALWEIPFEEIDRYQFAIGSARAAANEMASIQQAVERLDRTVTIGIDADRRSETEDQLRLATARAATWLKNRSEFLRARRILPDPELRRGDEHLWNDLAAYMQACDLWDLEDAFARQFVSGPHSGEIVKGHQIVIAELGLVPYEGKIVRDPATFEAEWSKQRRVAHVIKRIAFVRAMFEAIDVNTVTLYRGMSIEGQLEPPRNHTFVSASFSRAVAESHFEIGDDTMTRVLIAQPAPVERLFMTYFETAAMNRQFLEAEAVLLWEADADLI